MQYESSKNSKSQKSQRPSQDLQVSTCLHTALSETIKRPPLPGVGFMSLCGKDCQPPFPVLTILQGTVLQPPSARESPGNCVCAGRRRLVGCSPWGRGESDTTERLPFHFSLSCIGEGNGNPLQCSCLENPRDGEAWWAAVNGVAQSRT